MRDQILKEYRDIVKYWREIYYIPKNLMGELLFGLTPEVGEILENLPENERCEDCHKTFWHCTCAVEIDCLQSISNN